MPYFNATVDCSSHQEKSQTANLKAARHFSSSMRFEQVAESLGLGAKYLAFLMGLKPLQSALAPVCQRHGAALRAPGRPKLHRRRRSKSR